jgi:hypothetical protein
MINGKSITDTKKRIKVQLLNNKYRLPITADQQRKICWNRNMRLKYLFEGFETMNQIQEREVFRCVCDI